MHLMPKSQSAKSTIHGTTLQWSPEENSIRAVSTAQLRVIQALPDL